MHMELRMLVSGQMSSTATLHAAPAASNPTPTVRKPLPGSCTIK